MTPTHPPFSRRSLLVAGPVDANGDALAPVWQLVSITTASDGAVASLATAPSEVNVGPAHWGGGVWGYGGEGAFAFFASALPKTKNEANRKNEPASSVALRVSPADATIEVVNANAPFWHNVAVIPAGAAK